jgi:hypothetical protein
MTTRKTNAERATERAKLAALPKILSGDEEGAGPITEREAALRATLAVVDAAPDPDNAYDKIAAGGRLPTVIEELLEEATVALAGVVGGLKRRTQGNKRAPDYVAAYLHARDVAARVGVITADIAMILEAYSRLAYDSMEGEQLANCRLADGRGVTTTLEPYTQIIDKQEFRNWVEERDENGNYVRQWLVDSLQVPWPRVNSLAKEMLMEGEDPPPGTKLWSKPKVRLLP